MPESARGARAEVLDHVVERSKSRCAIERQFMTNLPGDHMIGARRVTRHAERSDLLARPIQGQAAAEDIDATDSLALQRVVGCAVRVWITAIRRGGVNRIALLQAEQAATRLHCCVQI